MQQPPLMMPIRVRMGAYVPARVSSAPSQLESLSYPAHLRPDPEVVVPNRATRRKNRRR